MYLSELNFPERLLLSIAIICIFCFTGVSQELTVMTYNIRYDNPGDGSNAWKYRKDKLCSLVQSKHPDLLGVQEALVNQLMDMDSLLPEYSHVGVGRDDGKTKGEYSAIFFRKSAYDLVESGTFWLSPTPEIPGSMGWNAACTRIVTWVKLKDKQTNIIICHFNTHFDHMGAKARRKSARLLLSRISEIAGDMPVIVSGDFNCTMQSKPMKILTHSPVRLKDSRTTAAVNSGPSYTYSTFRVDGKHEDIIDHILTNGYFIADTCIVSDEHADGCYFSDHLPVIVKFTGTKPPLRGFLK